MDKKTLIEKLACESFERDSFTGAWLYAENGEIVSKGAVGYRDAEDSIPLTENSIFQLASVTKQFIAAAVMLLVREGLICLDDDVTKYFPDIPYEGVKLRHLLSHTGGVPDYFDDEDWFLKIWEEEKRIPGNSEILRFLRESKLKSLFKPGDGFEYSNTGYNLLAEIVERVSGVPFEDFLRKNIFEPAGMDHTVCCHIRRDGIPFDNYAQSLEWENGKWVRPEDSEEDEGVEAFDGLNGDDYVYSDIKDMFIWDRALRAGKILTSEEQSLMYTPSKLNSGETYSDDDGEGYGFGWGVFSDPEFGLTVSHSGGMPGVHTWFERFIDKDRVLVILSCREPRDYRAHTAVFSGMRDIAKDREPAPVRTIEEISLKDPDRSKWESFCGKYEKMVEEFPLEEVFMKEEDLYAKVVWDEDDQMTCKLYPVSENKFGRKGGMVEITFGEGCLVIDGKTCKKL